MNRLRLHVAFQSVIELGVVAGIDRDPFNTGQIEPLAREVLDKSLRTLVGDQTPGLTLNLGGVVEPARICGGAQLVVRHGTPKKIAHACSQFVLREPV